MAAQFEQAIDAQEQMQQETAKQLAGRMKKKCWRRPTPRGASPAAPMKAEATSRPPPERAKTSATSG